MCVDRGSDLHGVDRAGEIGSEAIARSFANQQQQSASVSGEPGVQESVGRGPTRLGEHAAASPLGILVPPGQRLDTGVAPDQSRALADDPSQGPVASSARHEHVNQPVGVGVGDDAKSGLSQLERNRLSELNRVLEVRTDAKDDRPHAGETRILPAEGLSSQWHGDTSSDRRGGDDGAHSEGSGKSSSNLASDTAIGHLNNARQVLSLIHERIHELTADAFLVGIDRDVVAAGRRIAAAVAQLEAAQRPALRACSNCAAPMTPTQMLAGCHHCPACGRIERLDGTTIIPGESSPFRVELTDLGRGALEIASLEELDALVENERYQDELAGADVDATIAKMRDRYHAGLEAPDSLEGSEP
jgi:hypothetical protein